MILLVLTGCLDAFGLPWQLVDRPLSEISPEELTRICERSARAQEARQFVCPNGEAFVVDAVDREFSESVCLTFVQEAVLDQCDAATGDRIDVFGTPVSEEDVCTGYSSPLSDCWVF